MHTQNMHPGDNDQPTQAEIAAVRAAMVAGEQAEGAYVRALECISEDTDLEQEKIEQALEADAAFYVRPAMKMGQKGHNFGGGDTLPNRLRYVGRPA